MCTGRPEARTNDVICWPKLYVFTPSDPFGVILNWGLLRNPNDPNCKHLLALFIPSLFAKSDQRIFMALNVKSYVAFKPAPQGNSAQGCFGTLGVTQIWRHSASHNNFQIRHGILVCCRPCESLENGIFSALYICLHNISGLQPTKCASSA